MQPDTLSIPASTHVSRRQPVQASATLLALLTLLLITVLLGLHSLLEPFGRDQAEYATIADAWLRGQIVYRDIFNVKPPMTHLVHALAITLFGQRMLAIRLLDLCWQSVTVLCLFALGWRISSRRWIGWLAGLLYAASYFSFVSYWHRAQTDGFLTLWIALGMLAFYTAGERRWLGWYALGGVAIGFGVLFKYPIGLLAVLLAGLVALRERRRGSVAALALLSGFALPITACLELLALRGNLSDFLWTQLSYIPGYASRATGSQQAPLATLIVIVLFLLVLVPFGVGNTLALLGVLVAQHRGRLPALLPMMLWWFAALVHLIAQNKYYAYHALPLLAPQALLFAVGVLGRAGEGERGRDGVGETPRYSDQVSHRQALVSRPWLLALVAVLVAAVVATPAVGTLYALASGQQSWDAVYSDPRYTTADGDFSAAADVAVARYVAKHSTADEKLFIWGFEPSVYFLADRQPATRFIYNFPLYGAFAAPGLRETFYQQLEHVMPRYILIVKRDAMPQVTGTNDDSAAAFARDSRLSAFVATYYGEETVIEDFTVYRRR